MGDLLRNCSVRKAIKFYHQTQMFFTENLEPFVLYFLLMSGNLLLCWAVVVLFFFVNNSSLSNPTLILECLMMSLIVWSATVVLKV